MPRTPSDPAAPRSSPPRPQDDRPAARGPATTGRRGRRLGAALAGNSALVGLLVVVVAMAAAEPAFLTVRNLLNVGEQAAVVALLALGVTFVVVAGGIDLSVGSVAALSAVVTGWAWATLDLPGVVALAAGLLTGLAAGTVSGVLTAYALLPSFVATLAMLSAARGLALVVSGGAPVPMPPAVNALGADLGTGSWALPVPLLVPVVVGVGCAVLLARTRRGRWMYAVGGNASAAGRLGIPVKRVRLLTFALSGLLAGLAGLVLAGRLSSAQPQAAVGDELDAIAAVVIGGASLSGGHGRVSGTLTGALLLAVIRNSLNLLGVSAFWQQVVIGVTVAAAVGVDVARRRAR